MSEDTRALAEALRDFIAAMRREEARPRGRAGYKPNTIRSYERAVRVYIAPAAVGRLRVGEVRRRDLQALVDELLGKGLAPGTVSNVLNPVQAFYRWAIDREELARNPSSRIDLPHGEARRPRHIVSAERAAELIAAMEPDDRPIWATAFYAGLRRGELQALRCCDIDLGANLIHVDRGWDQEEGVIEPKSRAGLRVVPLLGVLREHLSKRLLRVGRDGRGLIFGRTPSQAFDPSLLAYHAKRAIKTANAREQELAAEEDRQADLLEPVTLHECRHTFASLLIDAGANPKAIQEFMGHSKIQTTFDTYGHLLPGSRDEVRLRMDAYLSAGEVATARELVPGAT